MKVFYVLSAMIISTIFNGALFAEDAQQEVVQVEVPVVKKVLPQGAEEEVAQEDASEIEQQS